MRTDSRFNANDPAEKRQALVRAVFSITAFVLVAVLAWNLILGLRSGMEHRLSSSVEVGIFALIAAVMANKFSVGKEIAAWLQQRSTFRAADDVVLEIARHHNVFVRSTRDHALDKSWYPGRTIYFRIYQFKHGSLQLRLPCDGMIEVAAMAASDRGGGCMYPPANQWNMWNGHCGQGYRMPSHDRGLFLERVTEVAKWIVAAQDAPKLGTC